MAGLTKEERLKREAEKKEALQAEAEAKAEAKYKEENDALKKQMEEMQKMLQQLMSQQSTQISHSPVQQVQEEDSEQQKEEIPLTKRIKVTSITTGGVNLKTSYDNGARKFRLEHLGQTKAIQYEYLIDCINTDRWLFEDGLVYINDPQVVEEQLLEEEYKKFLTPDKIQNILSFDVETIKQMVSNSTREIQETICSVVIDKINAGENIDLNKVYAIGNSCEPQVNLLELSQKIK